MRTHITKTLLMFLFLGLNYLVSAQDGITFKVETLKKPDSLLPNTPTEEIFKKFILNDANLYENFVKEQSIIVKYDILETHQNDDSLVFFGTHPFIYGMREAYAHHRPFVLSPDDIWLLISQGFSRHINANPEAFRDKIVNFEGKKELTYHSKAFSLQEINWEEAIDTFSVEIARNTKGNLAQIITADFSTTTQIEKIASEITLMNTMKDFFTFKAAYVSCGIPQITLRGTTEDWQKIYDKAQNLRQYDLDWWIDELNPILKQFIRTSKGKIDKKFWRNMYRVHAEEVYGNPSILDGWIVKFYPYNRYDDRFDLKELREEFLFDLPDEIIKVDAIAFDETNKISWDIELWAGFIGLRQNEKDFTLTPQMGWMVRLNDDNYNEALELKSTNKRGYSLDFTTDRFPTALKHLDTIKKLNITFTDSVFFPEWAKGKTIYKLTVIGKISNQERCKILKWFSNAKSVSIRINHDRFYYNEKCEWEIQTEDGKVFEKTNSLGTIRVLEIKYLDGVDENYKSFFIALPIRDAIEEEPLDLSIPNGFSSSIREIAFKYSLPSDEILSKIKKAFPNSEIYLTKSYKEIINKFFNHNDDSDDSAH